MSSLDIEQLFSPERLQKTWQAPMEVYADQKPDDNSSAIRLCHQKLLQLLDARFDDTSPLSQSLAELAGALVLAFPADGVDSGAESPSVDDIIGLLEQMEELIWSLELAQPEGGK